MPARWKPKNGKNASDGSVKIDQVIYVQREGQKAIALGKGGQTIKTIGELARKEMEELFGRRVHLFLFVKVREDWAEKPARHLSSEHGNSGVSPQRKKAGTDAQWNGLTMPSFCPPAGMARAAPFWMF